VQPHWWVSAQERFHLSMHLPLEACVKI
jgi:hypothetical protein